MRKRLERYQGPFVYENRGVVVVLVNIVSFYALAHFVRLNYLLTNDLSFAYYSNRQRLFEYLTFKRMGRVARSVKFLGAMTFMRDVR